MIKSKVITITEADNAKDAVCEFDAGLNGFELLSNTVGIVSVNAEFIESGVYSAIVKASPFPLAGMTTASQSSNGEIGVYLFTIMVLTSDDCRFVCGTTREFPEVEAPKDIIKADYTALKEQLGEKPKLVLTYAPRTRHCSVDIVEVIPEIDPGVIIFGGIASGNISDTTGIGFKTLYGENVSEKCAVFVLAAGDFTPEIFIRSLTKEAVVIPNIGTITKAEKNRIIEVNGVKAGEFFDKVGFEVSDLIMCGLFSSTLVLDLKDKGITVSRVPLALDNGELVCGGRVYEGAALSIAFSTAEVVTQTTRELTADISECEGERAALIYSCAGRQTGLLPEFMKELEIVSSKIPKRINYTACYVHGEICPVKAKSEKALYNNEHNHTVIACVL